MLALAVLAASVVSRFGTADSHAEFSATLHGTVGPDFVISLTFDDGTPVTSLPAGTYEVHVDDKATNHNFHLSGPGGVSMATAIENIESADWTVNLTDGMYTYRCDRHSSLTASFTVGNGQAAPPVDPLAVAPVTAVTPVTAVVTVPVQTSTPVVTSTPVTTATVPQPGSYMGTLKATLGPGKTIALSSHGKPVTKLVYGTYKLVIADRSPSREVLLRQTNGGTYEQPLTNRAFVGSKTVLIDLLPGRWKIYSASSIGLFTFFKVSKS